MCSQKSCTNPSNILYWTFSKFLTLVSFLTDFVEHWQWLPSEIWKSRHLLANAYWRSSIPMRKRLREKLLRLLIWRRKVPIPMTSNSRFLLFLFLLLSFFTEKYFILVWVKISLCVGAWSNKFALHPTFAIPLLFTPNFGVINWGHWDNFKDI